MPSTTQAPQDDIDTGVDYFSAMPQEMIEAFLDAFNDKELFAYRQIDKNLGPTIQSIFIKRGSPKALIRILIEKNISEPKSFYSGLLGACNTSAYTHASMLLASIRNIGKLNHWYLWQIKVLNALFIAKDYAAIAAWFKLIITPEATAKDLAHFLIEHIPSQNDFLEIAPLVFLQEYASRFTPYQKFRFFQKVVPELSLEQAKQLANYILTLQFPGEKFQLAISAIQTSTQLLKFVRDTRVLSKQYLDPDLLNSIPLVRVAPSQVLLEEQVVEGAPTEILAEARGAELTRVRMRTDELFRYLAFQTEQPPIKAYTRLMRLHADIEMQNTTIKDGQRFTPLSWAALNGHLQSAQALIVADANLEVKNISYNCIPLYEAADGGHTEMVRLLLAAGADINAKSMGGLTVLMCAAQAGHAELVQILAEAGADLNETNSTSDDTALSLAVNNGHHQTVKTLLALGAASINQYLTGPQMQLKWSTSAKVKTHYVPTLLALLEAGISCANIAGYTRNDPIKKMLNLVALFESILTFEMAWRTLLTRPSESFGSSAIDHYLVFLMLSKRLVSRFPNEFSAIPNVESCLNISEIRNVVEGALIKPYADIEDLEMSEDLDPEEAFTAALNLYPFSVTQKMAAHFFPPESAYSPLLKKTKTESELLHLILQKKLHDLYPDAFENNVCRGTAALEGRSLTLGDYLNEVDVNEQDTAILIALILNCQNTKKDLAVALNIVAKRGLMECVGVLVSAGADINAGTEDGTTALMMAAEAEHPGLLPQLLENGAHINATDETDKTALMRAVNAGNTASVEVLLTYGADVTKKDEESVSALSIAVSKGDINLIRLLLMAEDSNPDDVNQVFSIAVEQKAFLLVWSLFDAGYTSPNLFSEDEDIARLINIIHIFETSDNDVSQLLHVKNTIHQFKNEQHRYLAMYLFCKKWAENSASCARIFKADEAFLSFDEMMQRLEGLLTDASYQVPDLEPLSARSISEFKKVMACFPFAEAKKMAARFIPIDDPARFAEYEAAENIDGLFALFTYIHLKALFPQQNILIEAERRSTTAQDALLYSIRKRDPGRDIHEVVQLIADGAIYDGAILTVKRGRKVSENALEHSVIFNDAKVFELLLNLGVDLEVRNHKQQSPLFAAVFNQRYDMIDKLLALGAAGDVSDIHAFTPLHYALMAGDQTAARKLIKAVPNQVVKDIFRWALKSKGFFIAKLLLECDPNLIYQPNLIHTAVLEGGVNTVKWLMQNLNIATLIQDGTLLISLIEDLASKSGQPEIANQYTKAIERLIDSGANPNSVDSQMNPVLQVTMLHFYNVVERDFVNSPPKNPQILFDVIKLLIKAGADVDLKDRYNNTALMHAISDNYSFHFDIISLLLANGAKLQFPDGYSALRYTISHHPRYVEDIRIVTAIDSATDIDSALATWRSAVLKRGFYFKRSMLIRIVRKFYKDEALQEKWAEIEAFDLDELIQRFSNPIRFNPLAHVIENEEYPLARIYRESMWQGVYDAYEALLGQQGKAEAPNHLGILDFLIIPFVAKWLMSVSQNHRIHVFFRVSIKLVAFPLYVLSAALAALLTLPLIPVVAFVHAVTYPKANQLIQEINDAKEVGVVLPELTPTQIRGIKIRKYETDKAECIPPSRLHAFQALNVGGGHEPLSASTKFRIS